MDTTGMPCRRIIKASQEYIHQYQNLKRKLYNCNVSIFESKMFRNNIIPKFAEINIPNSSPASKFTQHKAYILRLNYEIKYFYITK